MKKLKNYTKEELESLDYDDIAFLILEEKKKKMKISDLFKSVCELLELSDDTYESLITDFFEMLTTDKRFIQLTNGYWDLKTKHSEKVVIEDDDEEYEEIIDDEPAENEEEKDDFYDEDSDDDDADDDLKDLVVIDEEDEEN